jgi:hypothetical protein
MTIVFHITAFVLRNPLVYRTPPSRTHLAYLNSVRTVETFGIDLDKTWLNKMEEEGEEEQGKCAIMVSIERSARWAVLPYSSRVS